ncbi:MAG TPA: TRAP transporter small permease [Rhizobiaceae bacterium]|nr:TRAP transporter small permease [Rhizobiaceae bacterium]
MTDGSTINRPYMPPGLLGRIVGFVDLFETRILWPLGAILLVATAALMLMEVVTRSGFGVTQAWAEELIRYMILWAVFIVVGLGYRRGHLVRTELITQYMSPAMLKITYLVNSLTGILFAAIMLYSSIMQVRFLYRIGIKGDAFMVSLWWVKASIAVAALGLLLFMVRAMIEAIAGLDPYAIADEDPIHE